MRQRTWYCFDLAAKRLVGKVVAYDYGTALTAAFDRWPDVDHWRLTAS